MINVDELNPHFTTDNDTLRSITSMFNVIFGKGISSTLIWFISQCSNDDFRYFFWKIDLEGDDILLDNIKSKGQLLPVPFNMLTTEY